MTLEIGKIFEGKIAGITKFGAFVELPNGQTGLVHISEVADKYVTDISAHLKENDVVKVRVLSLENGKIALSIKKAIEQQPRVRPNKSSDFDRSRSSSNEAVSFEDRLSKFLKDSDERMHDLKRSVDSKRGGGGYRRSAQ